MRIWLTFAIAVFVLAGVTTVWLALSLPTEGSARPAPARDAELPRVACVLPLVMGDLWGRAGNVPEPRRDINAADAQWLLAKVAGFRLPDGGHGCSPQDIDCDGDRDTVDALWVLRWVAELPYSQHEPCPDIGTEL